MIIIEGPDASGKSTLAQFLATALGAPVQSSEGPPQYPGEMRERLARYDKLPANTIFDRHPVISEEMYAYALRRSTDVDPATVRRFYARRPFIVYCDPVDAFSRLQHNVKPHDTPEHLQAVHENYSRLVTAYRDWAFMHASFIYRIGDNMDCFIHYATDFVYDIDNFHHKFDIEYEGPPRHLPHDLKAFRIKFLAEELCEYAGVSELTKKLIQTALTEQADPHITLEDEFDALIDLVYVALGSSHLHGFPFARGWSRVHDANMTKVRAPNAGASKRQHSADVIKPAGFRAPDLGSLVRGVAASPCPPHELPAVVADELPPPPAVGGT